MRFHHLHTNTTHFKALNASSDDVVLFFFLNWWKEQNKAHIYTDSKTQIMQRMYKKNPFSKSEYGQAAALTGPSPLLSDECK